MLAGISILCFAASYTVALACELSRLYFRAKVRNAVMIGFAAAGLFAHSLYLFREARAGLADGTPLASWYHGCLVVAWALAVAYLVSVIIRKKSATGMFLLPTILVLIGVAHVFPRDHIATVAAAYRGWSIVHGLALLLGTVSVVAGFFAGLIYLYQSSRLKRKLPPRSGFWLPSLERLQRINERSLHISSILLVIGLVSGVLLNLIKQRDTVGSVPWTDPIIWTSAILLCWLVAVIIFNNFYKPARQGRKVAYLTVGSFLFLGMVLAIILLLPGRHTQTEPGPAIIHHSAMNEIGASSGGSR